MFNHILIPADGSRLSDDAVEQGTKLARYLRAKVTYMTVIDSFDAFSLSPEQAEAPELFRRWQREAAERILAAAKEVAKVGGVDFSTVQVQDQDPYEAIVRSAQELNCDLIAMASHGRRGIAAIVLGSVTTKVLTHSTIPVLVIRSPPAENLG